MKLSNKTIFAIVAKMLGKETLTVKDGKVELTEDEEKKISSVYGETFLANLKAAEDNDKGAASIFNAMVDDAKKNAASLSEKDAQIAQLQGTINTLSEEPEQKPAPKNVATVKVPEQFQLNASAFHNRMAAQALASGNPAAAFAQIEATSSSSIDVTDLNAELGTVMPAGVKLDILTKRIYNGFTDAQYFTKVQSNTDYKASAALMSEVSQQFTPKWTPKGSMKFTPVVIKYRRHKINVAINPTDILKSWLLYLYEQGKTQAQMPITKYIIEQHIMPKVADDITLAMIGKGKFVDAGTVVEGAEGGAAKDSMDGYETILVEGKADTNCKFNYFKNALNPFELTDAQLIAYVDSFVDAISGLFAKKLELHCSPEFLTRYKRADFAINGKYTGEENNGKVRFTNFNLVPLESMYNSPILFATPRENFVMLVDYAVAERCINKIEEQNYDVKVFGEYSLSTGFRIAEAVYAAVPSGYVPSNKVASDATSVNDKWAKGGDPSIVGSDSDSSSEEGA